MQFNKTSGTFVTASMSAAFLVAGCHSSPVPNGFAAGNAQGTPGKSLEKVEAMPHLQAYDELYYVPPADDAGTD